MVPWSRALAALAEDLGSVLRTNMAAHNSVNPIPGNLTPSSGFFRYHACIQHTILSCPVFFMSLPPRFFTLEDLCLDYMPFLVFSKHGSIAVDFDWGHGDWLNARQVAQTELIVRQFGGLLGSWDPFHFLLDL